MLLPWIEEKPNRSRRPLLPPPGAPMHGGPTAPRGAGGQPARPGRLAGLALGCNSDPYPRGEWLERARQRDQLGGRRRGQRLRRCLDTDLRGPAASLWRGDRSCRIAELRRASAALGGRRCRRLHNGFGHHCQRRFGWCLRHRFRERCRWRLINRGSDRCREHLGQRRSQARQAGTAIGNQWLQRADRFAKTIAPQCQMRPSIDKKYAPLHGESLHFIGLGFPKLAAGKFRCRHLFAIQIHPLISS